MLVIPSLVGDTSPSQSSLANTYSANVVPFTYWRFSRYVTSASCDDSQLFGCEASPSAELLQEPRPVSASHLSRRGAPSSVVLNAEGIPTRSAGEPPLEMSAIIGQSRRGEEVLLWTVRCITFRSSGRTDFRLSHTLDPNSQLKLRIPFLILIINF